jgi:hypothetical protein
VDVERQAADVARGRDEPGRLEAPEYEVGGDSGSVLRHEMSIGQRNKKVEPTCWTRSARTLVNPRPRRRVLTRTSKGAIEVVCRKCAET